MYRRHCCEKESALARDTRPDGNSFAALGPCLHTRNYFLATSPHSSQLLDRVFHRCRNQTTRHWKPTCLCSRLPPWQSHLKRFHLHYFGIGCIGRNLTPKG